MDGSEGWWKKYRGTVLVTVIVVAVANLAVMAVRPQVGAGWSLLVLLAVVLACIGLIWLVGQALHRRTDQRREV